MSAEVIEFNSPVGVNDFEKRNLSTAETVRLLYLSFKFSQGDRVLQSDIFRYLKIQHPDWVIPESSEKLVIGSITSAVSSILPDVLHDYRKGGGDSQTILRHPKFEIPYSFSHVDSIREEFVYMQKIFEKTPTITLTETVHSLSHKILDRDYVFLVVNKGRVRSASDSDCEKNPDMNPFLSHLIYYGLEGNPTPSSIYDLMFGDIANYFRDNSLQLDMDKFEQVKSVYQSLKGS